MREKPRDKERLQHIIDAADFITEHTDGISKKDFISDKLLYGAVIYYTMIIGEAAYKLSPDFTKTYNEVRWLDIASMRHHLVHGYYQIDSDVVWNIIKNDVVPLRERVSRYIAEIDWEMWEK